MNLTTALTGMLPFIVLVSAVLSAIVSLLLLRLYKRAVVRSMNASSGSGSTLQAPLTKSRPTTTETSRLKITIVDTNDSLISKSLKTYAATSASLRRLGIAYTVTGIAYAIVLSLPWMVTAGGGLPLSRLFWLIVCYAWPTVVTLLLVTATTYRPPYISLVYRGCRTSRRGSSRDTLTHRVCE